MGIYELASLGDRVWIDADHNGIQDAGEDGVADVNVTLKDSNGVVVATTTTDANGNYTFSDLEPGDYSVAFDLDTLPKGYVVSDKDQGSDDTKDSDVNTTTGETEATTLEAGENDPTWDMGIYLPKASIGDRVWYDDNVNGIQDAGEDGVADVTLYLLDENGTKIATTTTDSNGNYMFEDLNPLIHYIVKVDANTLPDNYEMTIENTGADGLDSDISPSTYKSDLIVLEPNESDISIDAGIHEIGTESDTPYMIGTHFWVDDNKNGIFDGDEKPIANALVELFDENGTKLYWVDAEHSGLTTDKTKFPAETYTSETGAYNFYVPAGTYGVRFHIPNTDEYDGYVFEESKNNDNDNINVNTANEDGITKTVTVGPGIATKDLTLDAGINCGCDDAPIKSNGGDAFNFLTSLMMIIMTLLSGLYLMARDEEGSRI
jgi:protocatechuate 3,4-dioxygenase beta subunit